jgi:glycosyltransferase involved in cell wall biosynthesis
MRVLHVTAQDISLERGYRASVLSQIEQLRRRNVEVDLLSLVYPRDVVAHGQELRRARRRVAASGARSRAVPLPPDVGRYWLLQGLRLYQAAAVGAACRLLGADLIHAHGTPAADAAVLAKRLHGRPLLFEPHGAAAEEAAQLRGPNSARVRVMTAMETSALRGAQTVKVVSGPMRDLFREQLVGEAEPEWLIVPSCVETEQFRWAPAARAAARANLGLDGAPLLVYAGGWQPYQLGSVLVDVFQQVQRRMPEAKLLVLVPHQFRQASERDLRKLGADSWQLLSVSRDEMPRLLTAADLGLALRERSTASRVASPLKIGEYLACGVPVVLPGWVGDLASVVERHRVGTVVETLEADLVAARIAELLEDVGGDRDRWADRCTQVATVELSWEYHVQRVIQTCS